MAGIDRRQLPAAGAVAALWSQAARAEPPKVPVAVAMRRGAVAEQAALAACRRIVERTRDRRLRDAQGRPRFDVKIDCLRNDGDHGAAAIWRGGTYALKDAEGVRHRPAAYVFKRPAKK